MQLVVGESAKQTQFAGKGFDPCIRNVLAAALRRGARAYSQLQVCRTNRISWRNAGRAVAVALQRTSTDAARVEGAVNRKVERRRVYSKR